MLSSRKRDFLVLLSAPVGFGAMLIVAAVLHNRQLGKDLYAENGPIELPTFLFLVGACVLAMVAAWRLWRQDRDILKTGALVGFALGCFFVGGEEVAWGQWFVPYQTPEGWAEMNAQGEMTLHNLDGLQGKSEVLRVVFGLGGLAGLLLLFWKRLRVVAPPVALAPWFLLIALFGAGELVTDWVTLPIEVVHDGLRGKLFSELQELAIAGVALAYGISVFHRALPSLASGQARLKSQST